MYPQNSRNQSTDVPPEQDASTHASSIPQPADVWPPHAEATGDTEPTTSAQPTAAPGAPTNPRRRKPWVVAAIVVSALIVLGGAGAAAYSLYENPQKVLADSVTQLVTAKSLTFTGSGTIKTGSTNILLSYNGASVDQRVSLHGKLTAGTSANGLAVEGDAISDKNGDYYLKIANLKAIMASFLQGIPAQEQAGINQIVTKVDNKWIKVAAGDVPVASPAAGAALQQCTRAAFAKVQTDASYRDELTNLYAKHQFVVVKQNLGVKNMSVGYRLGVDAAKERDFIDSLSSTKLQGELKKCDRTFNFDSFKVNGDAASLPEVEIWSNIFTHQPKQLTITSSSAYSFTVNPVLNPTVTIDVPTGATDLKQLQRDLLSMSTAPNGSASAH